METKLALVKEAEIENQRVYNNKEEDSDEDFGLDYEGYMEHYYGLDTIYLTSMIIYFWRTINWGDKSNQGFGRL